MNKQTVPFLFIPQRLCRVGCGGFKGLKADGEKRNSKSDETGKDKGPNTGVGPVGKILQPFVHGIIGQRPGNDIRQDHPSEKFSGKEKIDVGG